MTNSQHSRKWISNIKTGKKYERLFVFVLTMEEILLSTDFKKTGYGVNIFKRKHRTYKAKRKLGKLACTATAGFVNVFSAQQLRQAFEAEILQGLQWVFFPLNCRKEMRTIF